MWVSQRKWEALEKRVADLEGQVQSQQRIIQAMQQAYNSGKVMNISNQVDPRHL